MVESDHSDKESQDEMPPLKVSNNSIDLSESRKKRLREETSEEENIDLDSKKLCTSIDINVNGMDEHIIDDIKDRSTNNMQNKVQSLSEGNASEMIKKSNDGIYETKCNKASDNNDSAVKKENDIGVLKTAKVKEYVAEECITTIGTKETAKEEAKEEVDDKIKLEKKYRKSEIEDAEVVEGLELSVECASDKESSVSSDNECGKDRKPIPKTIIIKAKPNDSELDVSSSEAEKSDSQNVSEIKSKQNIKKGKRKGRTSFSKIKSTDSEENNDVSDEDYSPWTKRKFKKTVTNKSSTRSPTESKRGRGKAKKVNKKSVRNEEEEEDENSNIAEDKNSDATDVESEQTKSEDESDNADGSNDRNRKKQSSKIESNKKIQLLKKYIRITGIHVKSYNDLWTDCKSNSAKISCLKTLLEKNGVSGRPTIEKCKKAKERNERLKDVAELNTSNIISEGRITRAQRNKDSTKESSKSPETPAKRTAYKRVLTLVDSESE